MNPTTADVSDWYQTARAHSATPEQQVVAPGAPTTCVAQNLVAAAFPPLPVCCQLLRAGAARLARPPDPLFCPPWLEDFGTLAIRAARDFDMPLSISASSCSSFFTPLDGPFNMDFSAPALSQNRLGSNR